MTTYKAYLIDVELCQVREVQVTDDIKSYYALIGNDCTLVTTCGISFLPEPQHMKRMVTNDLLVDDEGMFRDAKGAFTYIDWSQPVMGNALVVGADRNGETCDVTCSIDEVRKDLLFVPAFIANLIREKMGF